MKENRRRHERILIPEDKMPTCEGVNRPLAGRVLVLGTGGAYLLTNDRYPAGTEFELRIRAGNDLIESPCVVRDVESGGMGVEFTWLNASAATKLRKLIARIKS
ncbi:MAG: PilZ domain-containing protein [Acidobacteria bacterium]|nr:PilZ domain-containing protein [Acidobacteriota bacterium]